MNDLQTHPLADLFPPMSGDERTRLKADIEARGQLEPIDLLDGQILDGKNRYAIVRQLGLEPITRDYAGDSPVAYVISRNMCRRHLAVGQRAMIGVDLERHLSKEAKERQRSHGGTARGRRNTSGNRAGSEAREDAARVVGVSSRYISDAKTLSTSHPDLAEKVRTGQLTLPQAKRTSIKKCESKVQDQIVAASSGANWNVNEGDCIRLLGKLKGNSIPLIFAEPPHSAGVQKGGGRKVNPLTDPDYLKWASDWLVLCFDVLASDGTFWLLVDDKHAAEYAIAVKKVGLTIRAWLKWHRVTGPARADNFRHTSRHLFYCVKNPLRFAFRADAVSHSLGEKKKGRLTQGTWNDVWQIPVPTRQSADYDAGFPNQLPSALTRAIVESTSAPGQLVLDPFSGSASIGVAAIETGRRFLGFEANADFCLRSRQRLTAAEVRTTSKTAETKACET